MTTCLYMMIRLDLSGVDLGSALVLKWLCMSTYWTILGERMTMEREREREIWRG